MPTNGCIAFYWYIINVSVRLCERAEEMVVGEIDIANVMKKNQSNLFCWKSVINMHKYYQDIAISHV